MARSLINTCVPAVEAGGRIWLSRLGFLMNSRANKRSATSVTKQYSTGEIAPEVIDNFSAQTLGSLGLKKDCIPARRFKCRLKPQAQVDLSNSTKE